MNGKSKTLIDSWTMGEVIPLLLKNISQQKQDLLQQSMANFFTSILLFDEMSLVIASGGHPLFLEEFYGFHQSSLLQTFSEVISPPEFNIEDHSYYYYDEEGVLVFKDNMLDTSIGRAMRYINYGIQNKINYFPHPKRASYLWEYFTSKNQSLKPDRRVVLQPLEKHLNELYNEIDDMCGGKGFFNCSVPLLYDYIKENAKSPSEQLEMALMLREDSDVVKFRESLNIMDELLNEGRRADYFRIMKQIDDLSKEIVNSYTGKPMDDKFRVIYIFPRKFDIRIPSLMPNQPERHLHLTFLAELLDFGLNRRQ